MPKTILISQFAGGWTFKSISARAELVKPKNPPFVDHFLNGKPRSAPGASAPLRFPELLATSSVRSADPQDSEGWEQVSHWRGFHEKLQASNYSHSSIICFFPTDYFFGGSCKFSVHLSQESVEGVNSNSAYPWMAIHWGLSMILGVLEWEMPKPPIICIRFWTDLWSPILPRYAYGCMAWKWSKNGPARLIIFIQFIDLSDV